MDPLSQLQNCVSFFTECLEELEEPLEETTRKSNQIAQSVIKESLAGFASGLDIGPCSDYLTPEGLKKANEDRSNIKITDFDPLQKEKVLSILQKQLVFVMKEEPLSQIKEDMESSGQRFDELNVVRQAEVLSRIEESAENCANERMAAFRNGASLLELAKMPLPDPISEYFSGKDFTNIEVQPLKRRTSKKKGGARAIDVTGQKIKNAEHNAKQVARLRAKLRHVNKSTLIKDLFNYLEQLDQQLAHHSQMKWFCQMSKDLQKPVNDLSSVDLEENKKALYQIVENAAQTANKNADALIAEEEAAKKISGGKKAVAKAQPKKSSAPQKKKEEVESKAVSTPTAPLPSRDRRLDILNKPNVKDFVLLPRVKRWNTKIENIKKFEDKDRDGSAIQHYRNYNNTKLQEMKDYHNLSGLERLLADDEMRRTYTMPYQYKQKGSEKVHEGLSLYATLQRNGKKESGIVYAGIGNKETKKVIFHLKFEPINGKQILPEDITRNLGTLSSEQEIDRECELSSSVSFSIENDVVIMKIGKQIEEQITYKFYPL